MADRIRPLDPADAPTCDAIIASLPDWFGLQEGIDECAEAGAHTDWPRVRAATVGSSAS
jgi:hypothetical protein